MKKIILCFILALPTLYFAQTGNQLKVVTKDSKGKKQEFLPYFIQFGIMSKDHQNFRDKYKVDVLYENCVISPIISQKAKENNLAIAKTLTEKYGDTWKQDLGITPYGL